MNTSLRLGARLPILALVLALAAWTIPGPSAFAHGGGGGGGHGGGGHGGGGHSGGGHSGGGYHSGGTHSGAYHHAGYGYYNGFWPGGYLGWGGYGYGGYGYGYGYGYPYSNYGYAYPNYTYVDPTYGYGYAAPAPAQGRFLGIDEQAVMDGGTQGMQVVQVYAGSPAEQAGLHVGDVIHAANGYTIQQHGNLTWVIANAAPDGLLQMTVHSASDGAYHLFTARIP
jgi:hypothetical protein